jgi:hypothetical protein
MADLLFENQLSQDAATLESHALRLGLDVPRFRHDLKARVHAARVAEDMAGAEASGVIWRPTFFVNGALFAVGAESDTLANALDEAWKTAQQRPRSPCAASRELRHVLSSRHCLIAVRSEPAAADERGRTAFGMTRGAACPEAVT